MEGAYIQNRKRRSNILQQVSFRLTGAYIIWRTVRHRNETCSEIITSYSFTPSTSVTGDPLSFADASHICVLRHRGSREAVVLYHLRGFRPSMVWSNKLEIPSTVTEGSDPTPVTRSCLLRSRLALRRIQATLPLPWNYQLR